VKHLDNKILILNSAFSYEYGTVFTAILGMFVLIGGLFGMNSKKAREKS
jgi:hypothetical protein